MMKYKYLAFFVLTFFVNYAIGQQYTPMTANGYQMKRVKADSTLHLPSFCGVPTLRNSTAIMGALALDTCNNKLYKWTNQSGWTEVAGGGGSIDTTSLSNRINQKIDSLKRSSDSIYAQKNGTWVFQYKDSIGGGGGSQNLQQVTDVGNTTTNLIIVNQSSVLAEDGTVGGSSIAVYKSGANVPVDDPLFRIQAKYIDSITSKVLETPLKSGTIGLNEDIIDTLKRSTDSVYGRKNGTWVFQYKDSIGGGGGSIDTTSLSNRINNAYTSVTKLSDTSFYLTKPNTLKDTIKFNKDVVYTQSPIMSMISNDSNIIYFNADTANIWRQTIDTTNAFLISVSQPNDSSLTFQKGATSTTYIIRSAIAGSATRLVTTAYNNTGVTITKGSVVYISGRHSSNLPTIALAQADNEANSYKTFALVENDIADNSSGIIIQAGNIGNLNLPTATYTDGDVLYLSPTVAGGFTKIKPLAPYHICKIGSVTRAHPTFGSIELKIENGWQLDEMSDVSLPSVPADSVLLQFSRVDSLWHDVSVSNVVGSRYIKPSDTSVFQRKNVAAYTFKANNTNAAANATDQTFKQSGMQTYTGSINWTGTSPSGATNHTYNFTQVGNLVTLNITLVYATAGTGLTNFTLSIPTDCPAPKEQNGLGAGGDALYYGIMQISSTLAYSATSRNCVIRRNSGDTDNEIFASFASSGARAVWLTIQYFSN